MVLPKSSPWGTVQSWKNIATGIDLATTSSHGGIKLSGSRQTRMPEAFKVKGGWYEEDVKLYFVVLAFPNCFEEKYTEIAHKMIKNYYPDNYAKWSGKPVSLEESLVLRQKKFAEENVNNYVTLAAFGSWHENVPQGMVGVFAGKGGRKENGQYPDDCKEFLVPEKEYEERNELPFVIDINRHKEFKFLNR